MDMAVEVYSRIYHISSKEALTRLSSEYHNIPVADVLEAIAMKEREYYLNQHKYAITPPKPGVDDRYRTHLIDPDGKRICVRRKKLEDLENIIINYYKALDSVHSISTLKEEFLEDRKIYVRMETSDRDMTSYARFFDDSPITRKEIRQITAKELSDYRVKTVVRLNLGVKETQRFQSLLNAIWDYAVTTGYTEVNIARNLRPLGKAFFTPNGNLDPAEVKEKFPELSVGIMAPDPDNEPARGPQYYTGTEQQKLIKTCYQIYRQLGNTAYLAIIMCFCLGLRIGELVALKVTDFDFQNGVVHIRRREITSKDESGKRCFRISQRLKNGASLRDIPITSTCKYIFDLIVADNEIRGVESDWLFISYQNGDRMHSCSVDLALDRANEKAGLEQRSLHKIRKTVLSRLDMSQHFTLERIREIAGHSRGSMTLYTNYFYTIEDLNGIIRCKSFEDIIEYQMPDFETIDRLNQPMIFRSAI